MTISDRFLTLVVLFVLALFSSRSQAQFLPIPLNGAVAITNSYTGPVVTGGSINTFSANASGTGVVPYNSVPASLTSPDFPDVSVRATGVVTAGNPNAFSSAVNAPGQNVWDSHVTIDVTPPPGAAISNSVKTLGTAVDEVVLTRGEASLVGEALLGVGAADAAGVAARCIPYVSAALMAAQLGMAGYDFYQSMKAKNLDFNPDGSLVKTGGATGTPPTNSTWYCASGACFGDGVSNDTITAACANAPPSYGLRYKMSGGTLAVACATDLTWSSNYWIYTSGYQASPLCTSPSTFNSSTQMCSGVPPAATASDVRNAVEAMTPQELASGGQSYIDSGMPLPRNLSMIPSPYAGATPAISPSVTTSTTQDNIGNTTAQQSSHTASSGTPSNSDLPRSTTENTVNRTVTNGTPTSTTTTPINPLALSPSTGLPIPVGGGLPEAEIDICLSHPEILACANITTLGDVPAVASTFQKTVDLGSLTPVAVGPTIAICPPPLVIPSLMGRVITLDLTSTVCNYATAIKPFNIAAASIGAMLILLGAFRQNG